ncbi:hypothetical protein KA405_05815, partial [Patescibacteria group bacterium]|nr:hypothetical protein [Patescibacteria group bacterium]
ASTVHSLYKNYFFHQKKEKLKEKDKEIFYFSYSHFLTFFPIHQYHINGGGGGSVFVQKGVLIVAGEIFQNNSV